MVRIPSRRSDPETTEQTQPASTDTRTDTRTEDRRRRAWRRDRSADFSTKIERAAERAAAATRTAAAVAAAERAHARPRTSVLASASLVIAVVGGLTVLTGSLAGPGVVIGALALLLGLAGLAATGHRYRYLAGRTEATLAVVIAIGAIVIGGLALAGNLSWLDTDTDQVARLRDSLPSWLT